MKIPQKSHYLVFWNGDKSDGDYAFTISVCLSVSIQLTFQADLDFYAWPM